MRRVIVFAALLLLTSSSFAGGDNVAVLHDVLAQAGYFTANPVNDWTYPGGLLVADKNGNTFWPVPPGVTKPNSHSGNPSLYAITKKGKFSFTAVLTGLATIIGGNPGGSFSHSSTLNVDQIDASAELIDPWTAEDLATNNGTMIKAIRHFMAQKKTVFIVGTVLKSKKISVVSNSTWSGSLSFDSGNGQKQDVPDCSDKTDNNQDNNKNKQNNQNQKPGQPSSVVPHGAFFMGSGLFDAQNNNAQTPSANGLNIGGQVSFCKSHDNSVKLTLTTEKVFAVGGFLVVDNGGKLEMQSTMAVPKGIKQYTNEYWSVGGMPNKAKKNDKQFTEPNVTAAEAVSYGWTLGDWSTETF